jgi:tetratricopeptide (TPR) repeat protein
MSDAGSAGSSSSSSSDSSSSSSSGAPFDDPAGGPLADDDDAAAKAAAKRKAERRRLAGAKPQTQDEREAEDLEVAGFYMADSNFRGAYLRATDAVSVDAEDPEAHFALAEAARKLGKLDEALTHYKKTLTLDPVPKTKKAAEKAIKEMSGG